MNKLGLLPLAAMTLSSLALIGCGPTSVRIQTPPPDLLTCADEPQAPSLPDRDGTEATQIARDTETLGYILGLRSAWGDCKSKVAGTAAWAKEVSR